LLIRTQVDVYLLFLAKNKIGPKEFEAFFYKILGSCAAFIALFLAYSCFFYFLTAINNFSPFVITERFVKTVLKK